MEANIEKLASAAWATYYSSLICSPFLFFYFVKLFEILWGCNNFGTDRTCLTMKQVLKPNILEIKSQYAHTCYWLPGDSMCCGKKYILLKFQQNAKHRNTSKTVHPNELNYITRISLNFQNHSSKTEILKNTREHNTKT